MLNDHIKYECHGTSPAQVRFIQGDAAEVSERLAAEQPGSVSLVYMDPPFATGSRFSVRCRVGAKEWKSGLGSLVLPAYDDNLPREEYLMLMRRVLAACRTLLAEDGLLFLHVDYRIHAHLRILCDEIFGEKNFLNEIVWAYDTGGRSKKFFARKHDIILVYAASQDYDLHTQDVAFVPAGGRKNHMRKAVDDDGRVYRTIRSGGKTYTYFDDEPVPPSDVWTDVSQLQQKDPQRTGYDTQKPIKLLERIIKSASRPGDTVFDPFCGSGTTAEAAVRCGRCFLGADTNPLTVEWIRRRTAGASALFEYPPCPEEVSILTEVVPGIANTAVYLTGFIPSDGILPEGAEPLDAVDSWAVGTVENGTFTALAEEIRSFRKPALSFQLNIPRETERLVVRVSDPAGRRFYESPEIPNELNTEQV